MKSSFHPHTAGLSTEQQQGVGRKAIAGWRAPRSRGPWMPASRSCSQKATWGMWVEPFHEGKPNRNLERSQQSQSQQNNTFLTEGKSLYMKGLKCRKKWRNTRGTEMHRECAKQQYLWDLRTTRIKVLDKNGTRSEGCQEVNITLRQCVQEVTTCGSERE